MTSYFQYNDNKTKKPTARTEHGTEIIEIPGIMVTETPPEGRYDVTVSAAGAEIMAGTPWDFVGRERQRRADEAKAIETFFDPRPETAQRMNTGLFVRHNYNADRHEWQCACSACRVDRGEETL